MWRTIISFINHKEIITRQRRWSFIVIMVAALIGLIAAFALSVEAIELAKNPNAKLSCSINSVIDCAAVGNTSYSSLLGFPNSYIGMMVEPFFITVAITGLFIVKMPRKLMFAVQMMAIFALLFAYYLFHISVFTINVLCPWCLLVDVATIIMITAITRYNIREDNLYLSRNLSKKAKQFIEKDYDKLVAAALLVMAFAAIFAKFGASLFV
jgi:uncharacterized membrane protein